MTVPTFSIIQTDRKPQCHHRMPHRRPILGNQRARLMMAGMDPKCCMDNAWALVGGKPYCRQHAKEVALDWIIDNQEKKR